jgi:hypothetical protein
LVTVGGVGRQGAERGRDGLVKESLKVEGAKALRQAKLPPSKFGNSSNVFLTAKSTSGSYLAIISASPHSSSLSLVCSTIFHLVCRRNCDLFV